MKTIGAILSYNNPEMTDRLVENIKCNIKKSFDIIILDNGSNKDLISKYTTHYIEKNCRMTGGFNKLIQIVEEEYPDYDNIWFFTNDCYFEHTAICPLKSSEYLLTKYPMVGILHPSESHSVKVCYDVYNNQLINGAKVVIDYDIVCPIFTRNAIKAIGGKFNESLYQGWGLDYESSFLVRKNGLVVAINHLAVIGHDTSSTYDKGLDNLHHNRESYYSAAIYEMYTVFNKKYGDDWLNLFQTNYNNLKNQILSYE